jgi:hypothetical protein
MDKHMARKSFTERKARINHHLEVSVFLFILDQTQSKPCAISQGLRFIENQLY